VTLLGRLTAVSVMFAGVGIIGALASILASMLVPPPKEDKVPPATAPATGTATVPPVGDKTGATAQASAPPAAAQASATAQNSAAPTTDAIVEELASLRAEIAALRASLPAGPP
jgi:hypothetical protein